MEARTNRFLEGFSPEGRDRLLSHLIEEQYSSGTYLFREGDPADGICLVIEGKVEIIKSAGNNEKILGCFIPGDYLGEVAVLDGFGRSTDARAAGSTLIGKIPTQVLMEALDNEPVSLTLSLFQNVLNHLRKTNDLFVQEVVRKEKLSLVGEMASSLMHDLRNPLSGIHLAADLITMTHTDDETVHCCDKIRLQCDRVVAMAGELLEFSRGESKLDLAPTDTNAFLKQFITLNEEYFRRSGVKFNLEAEPAPIEIDSMRMLRLLQNLVSNAVEAIGSKSGGTIDIRAWVKDSVFYLTAKDNGPGIPLEVRDRIFEPFVTHGKKGGTGLGMAIARSVVTAHHGTITFETETGKGTTFLVQIPQNGAIASAA
ncbi:MAG: ATP-binding protein [Methylacidiphilales bacterium]|nr:ATP-binding protein [Candidatus Methylacidiphilales bacterium]